MVKYLVALMTFKFETFRHYLSLPKRNKRNDKTADKIYNARSQEPLPLHRILHVERRSRLVGKLTRANVDLVEQ